MDSKELKRIQDDLTRYDQAREKVLELSRLVTRLCGWSIIQTHRAELDKAESTLLEAKKSLKQVNDSVTKYPELKDSGSVRVAEQEYTEALGLYDLVKTNKMPSLKKTGVESSCYLLGLLDLIGEFRRLTLNHLRAGRGTEAEKTLALMESLYEDLLSLDHTAIIPTFRNKADNARRIIESTRGDVVTEIRRLSLERAIRSLDDKLQRQ